MSVFFLVVSAAGLLLAWNVVHPPARRGSGPLWFAALFTGELALFQATVHVGMAAGFIGAGWAGGWPGRAALVMTGLSVVLLVVTQIWALGARKAMEQAVAGVTGESARFPRVRLTRLLRPYPSLPRRVEAIRDIAYGPDPVHRLDRFSSRETTGPAPVLLQVHGGGWTWGRREQQARPLMHRMASAGWVVYSISYRLSPKATFPDHLIDVKRAIAWIREHGPAHGADPSFLAITGGSAGGQLVALAALTAGDPAYQPGFEDADTTVQACIPFYGLHDLLDRSGTRPKWPYLSRHVMKSEPADDPRAWSRASSTRSVGADRPPFLLIHGSYDTLVRPSESRRLAAALQEAGPAPVGLAEIPGATHAFDNMHSLRAERAVDGVQIVLEQLWARHRAQQAGY